MKLPNAEKAWIAPEKLSGYLLKLSHPIGGSKARYLQSKGLDISDVVFFEQAILRIAQEEEVISISQSEYGTKYRLVGEVYETGVWLLTVWQMDEYNFPRLVTAQPHHLRPFKR